MWIIKLETLFNGAHQNLRGDCIATVPEGWAMIPDDFIVPSTFPFVGIEAEEVAYTREVEVEKEVTKTREVESWKEVIKTREVESVDDEGNPIITIEEYIDLEPITITEEYTEMERVIEERSYTMMTVISMTEGIVPPAPEPEPTEDEKRDAQIFYTAMMTDTLLEG